MDIQLARHIARAAFRSSSELGNLVPFLKENLPAGEYQDYAKAVASAVGAIQIELLNKLIADHPALEAEIEASMQKYDRYL